MPQIVSDDLRRYMICCDAGQTLEPPKYLFQKFSGVNNPITRSEMEANYLTGLFNSSDIEVSNNIPIVGIAPIRIHYIENTTVIFDDIIVDTTSSTSFWTDINGWLQMNNYHEITYDALLDKWVINDPTGLTMIMIRNTD